MQNNNVVGQPSNEAGTLQENMQRIGSTEGAITTTTGPQAQLPENQEADDGRYSEEKYSEAEGENEGGQVEGDEEQ